MVLKVDKLGLRVSAGIPPVFEGVSFDDIHITTIFKFFGENAMQVAVYFKGINPAPFFGKESCNRPPSGAYLYNVI